MEKNFLDNDIFPGLTPNLSKLSNSSKSFVGLNTVWGTSWTMGGMVASQCGIPLTAGIGGSVMSSDVLRNFVCIGDILNANGYHNIYVGGASSAFAGKGNFYKSHGFHEVYGADELKNDTNERSEWGAFDDYLYEFLLKKIKVLSKGGTPYSAFALTLDTHLPNGLKTPLCSNLKYSDGNSGLLNSVHCADFLFGRFYERLKKDNLLHNTLLVVASDHLMMKSSLDRSLNSKMRYNTLLINHDQVVPEKIERRSSVLDVAPTILGFLGVKSSVLGLGSDLLSTDTNFVENYAPNHDSVLGANQSEFTDFNGAHGHVINEILFKSDKLTINGKSIPVKSIVLFDKKNKLYSIGGYDTRFDFPIQIGGKDDLGLIFDQCRNFSFLKKHYSTLNGLCALFTSPNTGYIVTKLTNNSFDIEDVRSVVDNSNNSSEFNRRVINSFYTKGSVLNEIKLGLESPIFVRSACSLPLK